MSMSSRPAALFLSHGGGPGFFMKGRSGGFSQMNAESPAAEWYRTFTKQWTKPSAIVVISAHWEERGSIRVTSGAKHALLYDYYGFPAHTYELGYDCPGEPVLANRIVRMLQEDGIPAKGNTARGYDHGVFIPLKLMYPDADIPVVQVSLLAGLSPEKHLKIGTALRTLAQEQDILIVGSGQATHNMASYPGYAQGEAAPREAEFMDWLKDTATNASVSPEERRRRLLEWEKAPYARLAHPREEHLLPMHVVSGCTDFAPGKVIYDDFVMGAMSLACVGFWGPDGEGAQGEGKDADGEKGKVDDGGADKVAEGLAVCSV